MKTVKKDVFDVMFEASEKFSPEKLCQQLVKIDNGVVVVDRTKILKSKDDERLFIVILNKDYMWNYADDLQDVTVYFQTGDDYVIGGVYNTKLRKKLTRRVVAVSHAKGLTYKYVYGHDTIKEICDAIEHA